MEQKTRKTSATTKNTNSGTKANCCSAKTTRTTKSASSSSVKNCGGRCTGGSRKSSTPTKNRTSSKSTVKSCS